MNHFCAKFLTIVAITVLFFVSLGQCDSSRLNTLEVNGSLAVNSTSGDMFNSVETQDNIENIEEKQSSVLPTAQPFFETTRSFIRSAYKSYLLLNPEIAFIQCLVKQLYMKYPVLVNFFQYQNLSKFMRNVYVVFVKFMNNIINADVLKWSDTAVADRQRVEFKVAQITADKSILNREKTRNSLKSYNLPLIISIIDPFEPNYNIKQRTMLQRFPRQAKTPAMGNPAYERDHDDNHFEQCMEIKGKDCPKELINNAHENAEINSNAVIDLSDKTVEREADELFNIDAMFWKSFGIEDNSLKKYSLAYCTKEYATDLFRRFIRNVLLN